MYIHTAGPLLQELPFGRGAVQKKVGLLTAASGGTLLLDEVGELPLDAQAMLLRFLQHSEIRAVGSTKTVRVDLGLIFATHRALETAIEHGTFRGDLYYRLRRVVLEVPPLRARREDIPLLVEHFRLQFNERYRLSVSGVTPQALDALASYTWPGNVRELETVLEQAIIFQSGGWVTPEDLGLPIVAPGGLVERAVDEDGNAGLTWCQREARRIATARGVVTRRDLMARCGISRELARRELSGLVSRELLRRAGQGRAVRYVPSLVKATPPA